VALRIAHSEWKAASKDVQMIDQRCQGISNSRRRLQRINDCLSKGQWVQLGKLDRSKRYDIYALKHRKDGWLVFLHAPDLCVMLANAELNESIDDLLTLDVRAKLIADSKIVLHKSDLPIDQLQVTGKSTDSRKFDERFSLLLVAKLKDVLIDTYTHTNGFLLTKMFQTGT
jgi:hypothetical protein